MHGFFVVVVSFIKLGFVMLLIDVYVVCFDGVVGIKIGVVVLSGNLLVCFAVVVVESVIILDFVIVPDDDVVCWDDVVDNKIGVVGKVFVVIVCNVVFGKAFLKEQNVNFLFAENIRYSLKLTRRRLNVASTYH